MTIDSIEQLRTQKRISQRELCAAADVHETTYSALKRGRSGGRMATIERLKIALDQLVEEQERREAIS